MTENCENMPDGHAPLVRTDSRSVSDFENLLDRHEQETADGLMRISLEELNAHDLFRRLHRSIEYLNDLVFEVTSSTHLDEIDKLPILDRLHHLQFTRSCLCSLKEHLRFTIDEVGLQSDMFINLINNAIRAADSSVDPDYQT